MQSSSNEINCGACSLSVAGSGRPEVGTMLVGAIGCNLAWALIDAIMYLMGCLAERAADRQTMSQVLRAATPEEARAAIASRLPPLVASALTAADLDKLLSTLSRSSGSSTPAKLEKEDWLGAAAVSVLVFGSTIPIVVPFLLISGRPDCTPRLELDRRFDDDDRRLCVRTSGAVPAMVDRRFHGLARLFSSCADHRARG